jgi:hypothetical protein
VLLQLTYLCFVLLEAIVESQRVNHRERKRVFLLLNNSFGLKPKTPECAPFEIKPARFECAFDGGITAWRTANLERIALVVKATNSLFLQIPGSARDRKPPSSPVFQFGRSFLTLPCEARTNFLELWQHSTDSLAAAPAAPLLTESDEFLDAFPGIDLGRV